MKGHVRISSSSESSERQRNSRTIVNITNRVKVDLLRSTKENAILISYCELDILWPLCRRFRHSCRGTKMPPSPPAWCLRRGMCRWENWYKVMMLTCWHVSRASCLTCVTCFVRFGSLLARLVHMVPWFVWMVQVSVSECKYCFQAICSSHVLQVVYIEIWWNCARLLVHIVVDCGRLKVLERTFNLLITSGMSWRFEFKIIFIFFLFVQASIFMITELFSSRILKTFQAYFAILL